MAAFPVALPTPEIGWFPEQVAAVLDGMDVSVATRVQYGREVRHFLAWAGTRPIHPNILLDFKKHLKARGDISSGTKAKYLAVARAFLRELYRAQAIPTDLTIGIKGFKVSRAHKRAPISDADIERAAKFISDDQEDARSRLILALLLFQGLRRIEVTRLLVEDFNRNGKTLMVLGKGHDDKVAVDLHPRTAAILTEYLAKNGPKSGPMFPSSRNHKELGISDRNAHAWRKAFTTRLIRSGMNLLEVSGYTRHASLEMLQIYYHRLEKTKTLPQYYAAFPS
jgi:integrase